MRKMLFLALFGGFLFGSGSLAAAATNQPAFSPEGPATCLKCHNDARQAPVLQSVHGVTGDARTPFAQHGCESCHGPSPEHLASRTAAPGVMFNGPFASPPKVQNAMCLACHQSGLRMNWQGSAHESNDVPCASCHTIHARKDPVLTKTTQPQVCFTCHAEQRADSYKFSHHPIREGKVVCADCHNPHGSPGPKLLKEVTVNETCYNCHAEKRGPVLWEHPPVRENCLNCHEAHGSVNARLLIERTPYLCQECHDGSRHPGQPYSGQNLAGAPPFGVKTIQPPGAALAVTTRFQLLLRGCTNCHSEVHGSNSPAGTVKLR